MEIGIALGLKGAISCIFGSLLKDDCNIKDEIIDISKHIGYDGGSKDKINRKRLIGNTYQIYRSILHQLAIDENWNNVYSDITLPSGDMGTIKVERVDDERESKGV